ncbi:MAG TPA: hypothetical protein VK348_12890, partial [Planctomycetota bacterium]|nr:hypothetical protein [Planctomycetota bacterium]
MLPPAWCASSKVSIRWTAGLFAALLPLLVHGRVLAQDAEPPTDIVQQGKYRLYKFEQPIGEESWELSRAGEQLLLHSKFKFTDRGSPVPLTATMTLAEDLTPKSLVLEGNVSRFSTIDTELSITGKTAEIREGKQTRQADVPERFFAISGYAPVAVQMLLVRYAEGHEVKGALATLPAGEVRLERRGHDTIKAGDQSLELERYRLGGLIWGNETLWLDAQQQLVAMVGVDAEFDHFEALRADCEGALTTFVALAAADGMSALADLAGRLSPAHAGALAITHAHLIDGSGKPPVADATIVVDGGRITAAGAAVEVQVPAGAVILDVHGNSVLPGLFDMHAHFEQVEWGPVYLAAGVTTVRDCGNEFDFITAVRDAIRDGRGLGPRLLLAGIVDGDSRMALGIVRANNAEEAHAVVSRYHAAGFQQIKIYSSVKADVVTAITAEAHKVGMTVTGHVPNRMNAIQAVEAGMDQINHIQYPADVMRSKANATAPGAPPAPFDPECQEAREVLALFKAHGTVIDPTLVVFEWAMHSSAV